MFRLQLRPFLRSAGTATAYTFPRLVSNDWSIHTTRMSSRQKSNVTTLAEIPTLQEQYKDFPKPKGRQREREREKHLQPEVGHKAAGGTDIVYPLMLTIAIQPLWTFLELLCSPNKALGKLISLWYSRILLVH